MFKTLRTDRNEIITIALVLLFIFTALYYAKMYFPPAAYLLTFFYYVTIAAFVFLTPWFFMRITMPNTMGVFINEWFETAWKALGKPGSFRITKKGRNIPNDEKDLNEPFQHAGELQAQFKLTILVYLVMLVAGAIIALAAFSQGISIPVIG